MISTQAEARESRKAVVKGGLVSIVGWAEGSLGSKRHFRVRSTSGGSPPSRSGGR